MSVRLPDGTVSERPLRQVTAGQVVRAGPWRMTRSARGQAHYPGYYWSATSGGHVIYESRLELARLLLADFDPDVVAIAAQPFLLRALAGGRVRRHVPDFLLLHADQRAEMVNVKPASRLADPAVAEALAWPGELFEDLCVPKTSSISCDQAIFVDQAIGARAFPYAVLVEVDRLRQRFQRGSCMQGAVRPVQIMMALVLAQDPP